MKEKSFADIAGSLKKINFADQFDFVAGITDGGIVPAYLAAHHLRLPIEFLRINFRDDNNEIRHPSPVLLRPISFEIAGKSILIADDRAKTGQTLDFVKLLLKEAKLVKTFVINGKADYFLFDEECFANPWDI